MSTAHTPITIAIASTFTADPIDDALRFWLAEMGLDASIAHAPYHQVLQQLLDPSSLLGRTPEGVNLLLVRFEDWLRFGAHDGTTADDEAALLRARLHELVAALRAHAARVATPTWIWVGPVHAEPGDPRAAERQALYQSLAEELREAIDGHGALAMIDPSALERHVVPEVFDPRRDVLGHIPYSDAYFAALATVVARRIHATKVPPIKVIAIDCDNTLWQGVVGEDGIDGICLPPGKLALQRALIAQQQQGIMLCLLSKNVEDDVLAVLDERVDMLLRREHVVAHRINWHPKSVNLASLASELDLGLDAFVFLDDNPVECAEMRAAHPQVTTLQVPEDHEIAAFLEHLWVLDRLQVTEEDRQRTRMYRENAQRAQLEQQASSIAEFIAGLELVVDVAEPTRDELARVAQLTQRTNQFNLTTRRRSEAEIEQLAARGLRCLRVTVKDRFGDYGLVGVVIYGVDQGVLRVDSLLLSCRVLGRGVEHAMLVHLGEVALREGASTIELALLATKKNQPARNFLRSLRDADVQARGPDLLVRIAASAAQQLEYVPGAEAAGPLELARTGGKKKSAEAAFAFDRSRLVQRAATAWRDPAALLEAIADACTTSRPPLDLAYVEPVTPLQHELASLWAQLLHVDRVGIDDGFAALGGTSVMAAAMFARIDERHGVKLPMTAILQDDTVAKLARRIEHVRPDMARTSLLQPLRVGPTVRRHLFLVHDGDGETLLYLNLARRLPEDVAVYGIEPDGTPRTPIRQTRIEDMARRYLQEIRRVQPRGPYAVGGMCAGGVIAFEMALQLQAAGEQVELVALLDAPSPRARIKPFLVARRRVRSFVGALRGTSTQTSEARTSETADAARAVEQARTSPHGRGGARLALAARKLRNTAHYELTRSARHIGDLVRFRSFRAVIDRGGPVPRWLERLSVRTVYDLAKLDYQPRVKLDGKAVLFRATRGEGTDEPFVQIYADPSFDWPRWLSHGVSVVDVPGGHSSMLQDPHVTVMAERMAEALPASSSPGADSDAPDPAHEGTRYAPDVRFDRLLIVIVDYKSATLTLDALTSLEAEVRALPGTHVTVVENASGDAEALARGIAERGFGDWVTLDASPRNGGFAYGNNRAIRPALASKAPPRYVLLLNPDTRIHPGAVEALLELMDTRPDVGIAGSSFENDDGSDWPIAFRFPSILGELDSGLRLGAVSKLLDSWVVPRTMNGREAQVDWVAGASMMIRCDVFRDIGLLDEGYFLYHEETDFCLRARRAGWNCWYVPQSRVIHIGGQSTGVTQRNRRPPRMPAYCFESRRRYFLKNHGLAYAMGADLSFGLGFALWRARRAIQGKPDMDPPHYLVDFWKHSVILPRNHRLS